MSELPCKNEKLDTADNTSTSNEIPSKNDVNDVSPDMNMKHTLEIILKYSKETVEVVNQNNFLLKDGASAKIDSSTSSTLKESPTLTCKADDNSVKSETFLANMTLLEKVRTVEEILNNELIKKHFKLIENRNETPTSPILSESLQQDMLENIASEDIEMPDIEPKCSVYESIQESEGTFMLRCLH